LSLISDNLVDTSFYILQWLVVPLLDLAKMIVGKWINVGHNGRRAFKNLFQRLTERCCNVLSLPGCKVYVGVFEEEAETTTDKLSIQSKFALGLLAIALTDVTKERQTSSRVSN